MVQGADVHVCVEKAKASHKREYDGCIPAEDQCSEGQQDNFSETLINYLKRTGKKVSVASKTKATMMKKNDLVSADILEGRKSASCLVDEERRTPAAAKTKELLVYKRTRFKGVQSRGVDCHPTANAKAPIHAVSVNNDRELGNDNGKENDATYHSISVVMTSKSQMTVHPQAANPSWATHKKRSTHRRNKFATKKQRLMLGGMFPLCDDAITRFRGK